MKGTFKGALIGALTSTLVLAGASATAAIGVGEPFRLGLSNSVNQRSDLTGTSANGMLRVINASTATTTPTIQGVSNAVGAPAVRGTSNAGGNGTGVHGTSAGGNGVFGASATGRGVRGQATSADGTGGFFTGGTTGTGVFARAGDFGVDSEVTTDGAVGVRSTAGGSAAFGVFAITTNGGTGVVSSTSAGGGTGVSTSSGAGTGVSASNGSATNPTVVATNGTPSGTAGNFTGDTALNVEANGMGGTGLNAAITGDTNGDGDATNDANNAIFASSDDINSSAVITANTAGGSTATSHEAIETFGFLDVNGDARVTGTLTKGAGAFEIDHPLDPANYYLRHSFVESPDMKNVYDGLVTTDGRGRATVDLPDYFGALNKDFRYQLTVIGGEFAQAIVSKEIAEGGRTFEIRTSKPNVKVSWQVTGIRKDAYATANPIVVVEKKTGAAAASYLHPELFGQPNATPLGLDLATPSQSGAAALQAAQADLLRLIDEKAKQALNRRRR
jgi:hypothetical protein